MKPNIQVPRIDSITSTELEVVQAAFEQAEPVELRQAWLDKPQPEFRPGTVRVAWQPAALWLFAELHDDDMFNAATRMNEQTWQLGDVFEIFLRSTARENYIEFHVTPENQLLQIGFPSAEVFRALGQGEADIKLADLMIAEKVLESRTWVQPEKKRWHVLAGLPPNVVTGADAFAAGETFLFSFCRYDCTRGVEQPVLSSTSPHERLGDGGYHRQADWGTLRLV